MQAKQDHFGQLDMLPNSTLTKPKKKHNTGFSTLTVKREAQKAKVQGITKP